MDRGSGEAIGRWLTRIVRRRILRVVSTVHEANGGLMGGERWG